MIGGTDLSKYLINFDSSEWANQANTHLQNALQQGLQYSKDYNQQAVNTLQDYNNKSQTQMRQGFNQAQALDAPQHLATYNALDAYQGTLGLPTPQGGSFQLAQAMQNQATGQPLANPQQQQMVGGYNQGLLSPVPINQGLFPQGGQ